MLFDIPKNCHINTCKNLISAKNGRKTIILKRAQCNVDTRQKLNRKAWTKAICKQKPPLAAQGILPKQINTINFGKSGSEQWAARSWAATLKILFQKRDHAKKAHAHARNRFSSGKTSMRTSEGRMLLSVTFGICRTCRGQCMTVPLSSLTPFVDY